MAPYLTLMTEEAPQREHDLREVLTFTPPKGKARAPGTCQTQARFGFTVTRQVGNAVVRNRIRRRLKAAVAGAAGAHARSDFDYVVIARRAALERSFSALVADLVRALDRIDRAVGPAGRRKETRNTPAS